ncbi:hypothetical protein AMS68_006428 [Peltaster fructicola]|uniref:Zn(2)-C6 fungal-type domain-containing protein n=1 Tax=Peltaster fructicola TaxID=286661 RepID=A0A6H0Y1W2_9PEZI|nr:hypothetical protein AMS68_006428 [Peltaster fructicola]
MSPTPSSPAHHKLSLSHRTSSQDSSADGIRKRVCKACDRCRLKKSKCDGSNPCSRCKADNAICVFGERKKSHDKVYPKGYVEMLEQQQTQLVSGLQEMYRRLQSAHAWDGKRLPENNGHPLTHDILAALNLLEAKHDGSGTTEAFEEDVQKLQSRLIAEGHGYVQQRRGSISSESEHSQHGTTRATTTPVLARPNFRDSFNFGSSTSSPLVQSPVPQHTQPKLASPPVQTRFQQNDPQLYAPEWAQALSDASNQQSNKYAFPTTTQAEVAVDDLDLLSNSQWQTNFNFDTSYNAYPQYANLQTMNDVATLDGMDVDFSKFVNPSTAMEVYI